MAQKILTTFIDDTDGTEAEGTVRFGLDGASYEIDLNAANETQLRKALAPYVENGRRSSTARPGRVRNRTTQLGGGASTKEIRQWAEAQGIKIEKRGRVPANIVMQFNAFKMGVKGSTAPVGLRPPAEAQPAAPKVTFTEPVNDVATVKSSPAKGGKATKQSKTPVTDQLNATGGTAQAEPVEATANGSAAPKGDGKAKPAKPAKPAKADAKPVKTATGHDPALRGKAVRLVQEGGTIAATARELGVAEGSVRNWVKAAEQVSAKTA